MIVTDIFGAVRFFLVFMKKARHEKRALVDTRQNVFSATHQQPIAAAF